MYCPARTEAESLYNPDFAADLTCLRVVFFLMSCKLWIPADQIAAGKPAAEPQLARRTPWSLSSHLLSLSSKAEEDQLAPVLV